MNHETPNRRVGSITLGAALILCGVYFLLYYFWPAFDFLLAARLSPLLLVALGVEVLCCAISPQKRRYDFLSVGFCLVVMLGCFYLTLLPLACRGEAAF